MVPELTMPEIAGRIAEAVTPYLLWFELWDLFKAAYSEPKNSSLIERIYKYASWCDVQPRGETADSDMLTCVAVCFYEEIPAFEPAREDMPNWFTEADFRAMRGVLSYKFTDDDYREIEKGFDGHAFRRKRFDHLG
jgi:hypothetical protein